MAPETFVPLENCASRAANAQQAWSGCKTEIDLLDGLGIDFDHDRVLAGEQTPVFFGSALTNFGVRLFLDAFVELAPAAAALPERRRPDRSGARRFLGLCLQDPGQHEPQAPRQRGLCARLLGARSSAAWS